MENNNNTNLQAFMDYMNGTEVRGYKADSDVNYKFMIDSTGRKYIKIAQYVDSPSIPGKSVHCFIDRDNGMIYKPAGWNGPAKSPRANINDIDSWKDRADYFGTWLYGTGYFYRKAN